MKLSELVSALTPTQFTELALVLFLLVFVAVAIRHGGKRRAAEHAACAAMPLADDAEAKPFAKTFDRGVNR